MLTTLHRLTDERDRNIATANGIAEKATAEDRDVTDAERAAIAGLSARNAEIDQQLATFDAEARAQRSYAALRAQLDHDDDPAPLERRQARPPAVPEPQGWGDLFVRSAAFESYPGAGSSQRVDVPFELEQRAAIGISTFPDQGLPPYYWNPAQYNYVSPLLNVVGKVTTGSNAVSYVEWAPNPQAAAGVVAEGALKPEAVMTATGQSQSLVTWAHWKEITRQALEDIPQIRSTVENRLRQGLVVAIEESIVANLIAATIPPVTGSAAGGDTLLAVIRQGIGTVQAAGYANPNAVLLNPADYADLDIAVMTGTLNGPTSAANYWGLRPIASNGVPAGTAWVGDFSVGVTLFTRGTAQVYLTDSHADNFIRNVLLLLAETRGLAVVTEPAAIAECTVGA